MRRASYFDCPREHQGRTIMERSGVEKYTEVSRTDWIRTAIYTSLYAAALIAGALVLIPVKWPLGFILWLVIVVGGGMLLLVAWHARNFAYRCAKCQHEFEISLLGDLVSPNGGRGKYLKCPGCSRRGWAVVLKKTTVR